MKLIFDHTKGFGKMQDQVIFYAPYGALFEKEEYDEALATGWFPTANGLWFQSRSTRINLSKYSPNRTTLKCAKDIKFYPQLNINASKKQLIKDIYSKYTKHKGFKETSYTVDEMLANSHGNIFYAHKNSLIGFLFYKIINKNFLAVEFAWDYSTPSLSLGSVSMYYAWQVAKHFRSEHIYMSAGYESCCQYKASFRGFQWWTGINWSENTKQYKELCLADDRVQVVNYKYT